MKLQSLFYSLVFLSLISCASTPDKRSLGEVIDDAVISNKLKVKLLKDKEIKAFKLNIDTWKGIVSLRGKVASQSQINHSIEVAERQPGVKEVKSYLVIDSNLKKSKFDRFKQAELAKKTKRHNQPVAELELPTLKEAPVPKKVKMPKAKAPKSVEPKVKQAKVEKPKVQKPVKLKPKKKAPVVAVEKVKLDQPADSDADIEIEGLDEDIEIIDEASLDAPPRVVAN